MPQYTLREKTKLLDGLDVWHTKPIQDIPSIMMADGPHGLRKQEDNHDNLGLSGSVKATAFPTASLLACSWNTTAIEQVAKAIAKEAKANGVHIVLGPGINIKRSPLCGRNFEYFSEDPYLAAKLASTYVRAMESTGVGVSVKHFCCNNQERYRFTQNSVVDERALREIYLYAFRECVKENPATIMASYNRLNGSYTTESPELKSILRDEWQYNGVVVTDWGACHNRVDGLMQGCDLEMPSSRGYHTNKILKGAKSSNMIETKIDESFLRIKTMAEKYSQTEKETYDYSEHHQLARKIARESMVLLKNDHILPLTKYEKITILGGFIDQPRYQGGGSSHINPHTLENINDVALEYSENIILAKGYEVSSSELDDVLLDDAITAAKDADKVVVMLGLPPRYESEGIDRSNIQLPKVQLDFLDKILQANKQVIVCIQSGSVVDLRFIEKTKGGIMCYLAGQANARPLLDILFGIENPSGRLAETFIGDINECNVQLNDNNDSVYYDESIYVGYRYYVSYKVPTVFPFGYGLSYTQFTYANLCVSNDFIEDGIEVSVDVKNVGNRNGKEVVQLYVENNKSCVYKAKRELKGFEKITLEPGEEKKVIFFLNKKDFAYYDVFMKQYNVNKGSYKIQICRNAEEVICGKAIKCMHNETNFVKHPKLSYHLKTYDVSDFENIYQKPLPNQMKEIKRPFTLSVTLEDLEQTKMGKWIVKAIIKKAKKVQKNIKDDWMQEIMVKTLKETPLRSLAMMSGGALPMDVAQGMIDILNYRLGKGIYHIIKGVIK